MKIGRTFVEKILNATAGSIVYCEPDMVLSHDNSARVRKLFKKIEGQRVLNPGKLLVVLDRKMTGTTDELIRDYNSIHAFMKEQQVEHFLDCDKGICHQVLSKYIRQGMIVAGSDSHTCTAGAFNCFAVGVNKTETAVLWKTGKMWFRIPETIKINLENALPEGVYAKDLALWVMGMLKDKNVNYRALEYHGDGVHTLSIDDRMTIANVSAEMGVKNSVFPPDDTLADYFGDYAVQGIWADEGAMYEAEYTIDMRRIMPLVVDTCIDNTIKSVSECGALEIQQGLIGACASGRMEDIRVVARILKDKKIKPGFQLSIVPASREIYLQAIEEGLVDILVKAGASILGSSCGPCLGSSHMIQADTKRFISTTNSNSMQRLSAIGVEKYIASPATVAVTALTGVLGSEAECAEEFPYWSVSPEPEMIEEYDNRKTGNVWNYADMDNISCGQLYPEQFTYRISMEDVPGMAEHLLAGLDPAFAGQVKAGDIIFTGEDLGCGKLNKHSATGLVGAGVKAIITKSVSRNFFRMAANHGLWVIIAPQVVDAYRPGDTVEVSLEDKLIRLNQSEIILPGMDPQFVEMLRKGGMVNSLLSE